MKDEIVIGSTLRTPVGAFAGSLKDTATAAPSRTAVAGNPTLFRYLLSTQYSPGTALE